MLKEQDLLNRWESFFLILTTVPIMGHVIILPLMYDVTGRDSWISALLSFPIGLALVLCIHQLRRKYPEHRFSVLAEHLLGKLLGKGLVLLLVIYFLFLSALSAAALADMIHIAFLPETPAWALVIWFLLFCLYAARKGTKIIALTGMFIGLFALLTGHSISFIDMSEKDANNLLPFLEYGWTPVLWGTAVLISVWIELLFLLFLPLKNLHRERFLKFWIFGAVGICFTMLSTMTGTVMIFGMGQTDNFNYPALETVRILTLGFIDRFDIYGLILMSSGCYIRSSLFFRICYEQMAPRKTPNRWVKQVVFWGLGILINALSILIGQNFFRVKYFTILYTNAILLTPIPFLLLLISWIKEKTGSK